MLWPPPGLDPANPNDASVVLLVEVAGVRLLLTGDVEPESQAALARAWPGLAVDVLKVPHHGSRFQDLDWLLGLGARRRGGVGRGRQRLRPPVAGDPRPARRAPAREVLRTDLDADVAVTVEEGRLGCRPVPIGSGPWLVRARPTSWAGSPW